MRSIAVVGAGAAGLAAAVEAAENGCSVTVFEKGVGAGGIRDGGIGPFAVESFVQQREKLALTKADAFNYMMEFTHWRVDAGLVSAYINLSADTIDWLSRMDIEFTSVGRYYTGAMPTQHNFDFMKGKSIGQTLYERALELGVEFRFNAPVKSLIKEGGAVVGAEGTGADGDFEVRADAVIVATGGFGGDPELVRACGYAPDRDLFYTFDLSAMSADGLRMVWEAGGARSQMMMDTYVGLPHGYGGPMGTAPALAALRQPENLFVNSKGARFMREDLVENPGFTGNIIHRQPGGCAFAILDDTMLKAYEEKSTASAMPMPKPSGSEDDTAQPSMPQPFDRFKGSAPEIMREAISEGSKDFYIADSIGELAAQAGIPPDALEETVEKYNRTCLEKEDIVFHKPGRCLKPLTGPRFYGARFCCDTYGGLGGIKIDENARVIDEGGEPIPGLYACGNDANTIYGDSYPFYFCGNTSGFAFNSGRIAARSAAK